jgi:hypothetical protein
LVGLWTMGDVLCLIDFGWSGGWADDVATAWAKFGDVTYNASTKLNSGSVSISFT